jgi:zinc transporter 7
MSQRLLQRHVSDNHSHNNNETTQITRSRSNSKSKSKSKSKNNSKKSESKSKTNVFFESFMKLSSMAWLNIIADCMHNFTDGLALGGIGGTPTILAILFHEIPHEIGDFTILMDSGLSKFEAIRTQFVTAISAVIGTLVGLYLTSHNIESNKINRDILSGLTGGGFLYIATTMMPTGSHNVNIEQILYEASSFTLGVLFMVMVSKLE